MVTSTSEVQNLFLKFWLFPRPSDRLVIVSLVLFDAPGIRAEVSEKRAINVRQSPLFKLAAPFERAFYSFISREITRITN
jgi:hypothetical protein